MIHFILNYIFKILIINFIIYLTIVLPHLYFQILILLFNFFVHEIDI